MISEPVHPNVIKVICDLCHNFNITIMICTQHHIYEKCMPHDPIEVALQQEVNVCVCVCVSVCLSACL